MTLLAAFLDITAEWRTVFPQHRTWLRAVRQSLGSLVCLGRRCLTRIIWTHGGQRRSWSAEYFLHSRCQWDPQALFAPILSLLATPGLEACGFTGNPILAQHLMQFLSIVMEQGVKK